jgi:hypothetical protein
VTSYRSGVADLAASIREAYAFEGAALDLGRGVHEEKLDRDASCGFRSRRRIATG